jgi:hypothetical protein
MQGSPNIYINKKKIVDYLGTKRFWVENKKGSG